MTPTFHDINKFPQEEGLLVFYISMNRISNESQNAATYMEHLAYFSPQKVVKTSPRAKVGAVFIYTDSLYLNSKLPAFELKRKYMMLVEDHKNSMMKLLGKDPHLIYDAFSFMVWNQLYLNCSGKFGAYLDQAKALYKKDATFRKTIEEDFIALNNPDLVLDDLQVDFFLEEHVMCHLIPMMQVPLENKFIHGSEKWILNCYPGRPLRAQVYLAQSSIFDFEDISNIYKNGWYNLQEKKLYYLDKIDLSDY